MLVPRKDIGMNIDDQSPPHIIAHVLPSSPASELVTPDTLGQACMDVHAELWLQSMTTE